MFCACVNKIAPRDEETITTISESEGERRRERERERETCIPMSLYLRPTQRCDHSLPPPLLKIAASAAAPAEHRAASGDPQPSQQRDM